MKKKYVLGILTVVVLMFGITACGKTTESTPEQNATQEEQKEDQDNDTSDQDVNQDGQNEQDQTSRSRQKTHRMQIIWEQEQLLCMPRTRMYPALIKKRFHLRQSHRKLSFLSWQQPEFFHRIPQF